MTPNLRIFLIGVALAAGPAALAQDDLTPEQQTQVFRGELQTARRLEAIKARSNLFIQGVVSKRDVVQVPWEDQGAATFQMIEFTDHRGHEGTIAVASPNSAQVAAGTRVLFAALPTHEGPLRDFLGEETRSFTIPSPARLWIVDADGNLSSLNYENVQPAVGPQWGLGHVGPVSLEAALTVLRDNGFVEAP